MEKLRKIPDWDHPNVTQGTTQTAAELLEETTKYYEWLFREKNFDGCGSKGHAKRTKQKHARYGSRKHVRGRNYAERDL